LSSYSLLNASKDMPVVAAELAPRFSAHGLVGGAGHEADMVVDPDQHVRHVHILLATTGQLPSTARLAMEFHNAGARVSLIAPSNHPAWTLNLLSHRAIYRAPAPST
jgi:hypothetical protein